MNNTLLTNLHSLWDSGLIHTRLTKSFESNVTAYYEYIYELMLNQTPVSNDNEFDQWIRESLMRVCKQIYLDENNMTINTLTNFTLGNIYYERNIKIIEQRLAQGGHRLATLLTRLATSTSMVGLGSKTILYNNIDDTKIFLIIGLMIISIVHYKSSESFDRLITF